jgi:hypothetical protein
MLFSGERRDLLRAYAKRAFGRSQKSRRTASSSQPRVERAKADFGYRPTTDVKEEQHCLE